MAYHTKTAPVEALVRWGLVFKQITAVITKPQRRTNSVSQHKRSNRNVMALSDNSQQKSVTLYRHHTHTLNEIFSALA